MTGSLAERVLARDVRAVARAISLIEDEDLSSPDLIRAIFRQTGRACTIGITGPPGAGKSTLVDRLVTAFRRSPATGIVRQDGDLNLAAAAPGRHGSPFVAVIAVDPTSPFSGGAVLGDRLRMQAHAGDPGVFIRSMATRGHLGGLARATSDAVLVLDAAGNDIVVVETVGVGQDEVEIVETADVSVVVLVPGTGDDVQALKAGLMEIADIFVVNKADREGADQLVSAIESNLSLKAYAGDEWRPPIVKTIATGGAGVDDLVAALVQFRASARSVSAARRKLRGEQRLLALVSQQFVARLRRTVLKPDELAAVVDRIAARDIDPYSAAADILARALPQPGL
jgi:LAO/AO transport system kinase